MATRISTFEELIHPISVEAYHLLSENGMVEERAELIEGVIFAKMPKNPIHSEILRRLYAFIKMSVSLPVFKEDPITLGDSEPEPDIAILPEGDYSKSHPSSALLILEVSNSSLSFDRKKASIYAKSNIPEYVIVNLIENKIEAHRNPREGRYTEIRILNKDERYTSTSVVGLIFTLEQFL
jgi:Uma2 family endonuclease